jgi:flagellar motor switch protein FliN/FliY
MDKLSHKKAAGIFAGAFSQAFAAAAAQAAGRPWSVAVLETSDLPRRAGQPAQYRISVEGDLTGECFVEFYEPQLSELCATLLNQPAAPFTPEQGEALLKLIAASMPALADTLSASFGELSFKAEAVAGLAFGGMFAIPLGSAGDQPSGVSIMMYFDARLLDALSSQSAFTSAAQAARQQVDAVNLQLVMDVELNVALRFGQRQLALREVLELTTGSVIELDRMVDEPVELLLDGKLIARGEAVIVDGNYGLRVTEIPQPIASHLNR